MHQMNRTWARHFAAVVGKALLINVVVLACGCTFTTLQTGQAFQHEPDNAGQVDELVGLALSGGGNRSALYASYVMQLMASVEVEPSTVSASPDTPTDGKRTASLLDRVQYISSVSGGSFAAAYFGIKGKSNANNYSDFSGMLVGGKTPPEYDEFFKSFHDEMSHNWDLSLIGLSVPGIQKSTARRLAAALDSQFLNGMTLADLDKLQTDGRSPYLIFNATNYDDGRRFVMTTIPSSDFCIDVEALLREAAKGNLPEGPVSRAPDRRDCAMNVLTPDGFDSLDTGGRAPVVTQTGDVRVAEMVTSSGAFPGAIGPVAYKVSNQQGYLHLIDGGVTDNSGVESMAEFFLGKLGTNQARNALIIELDAGLPFNATGKGFANDASPAGTLLTTITRPSDIQELRASIYRKDLWELAKKRVEDAQDKGNPVYRLNIVTLYHTEFLQERSSSPGLITLRNNLTLKKCAKPEWNAEQAHDHLTAIGTDYNLQPCDAEFLKLAACWSMHLHGAEIQARINGRDDSTSVRRFSTDLLNTRIKEMCPELETTGAL